MSSSPRSPVSSMKSSSSPSATAASASSSSISNSSPVSSLAPSLGAAGFGFFGLGAGSAFGALRGRRDFSSASGSNSVPQEGRTEEQTSELQSRMPIPDAGFFLKKKKK